MFSSAVISWLFSIAFVGFGLISLWLTIKCQAAVTRVGHLLHALMSLSMILMAWPATSAWALIPQAIFYALAAVWFVCVFVATLQGIPALTDPIHPHWHNPYHAVMMAAMAWMLYGMQLAMPAAMHTSSHGMHIHSTPYWATMVSWSCALVMLLGMLALFITGLWVLNTRKQTTWAIELFALAGMSAGMAAMFVPMLVV